jgi:mRNA interferase RelE/StbE
VKLYQLDIPPQVAEVLRHVPPDLKQSIKSALRLLSTNPQSGTPLVKKLDGYWKYRVKRFRIVYAIVERTKVLRIVAIGHRRGIYEEVAKLIKDQ